MQKDALNDVQLLHDTESKEECSEKMHEFLVKWNELVPDFATYFQRQWMADSSFGNWKVHCSKPGKLCTYSVL